MNKKTLSLIGLELVWWLITALIVYMVMRPINKVIYQFEYETLNIVLVVLFITLARYTFLLKYTFLAKNQLLKAILLVACFLGFLLIIKEFTGFLTYVEEFTWEPITGHLPTENGQRADMESYIWTEMILFHVGCILATLAFAGRLLMSIWRTHNLNTV